MSYEAVLTWRAGEKRPAIGEVSVVSGTVTVSSATVNVYRSDGILILGPVSPTSIDPPGQVVNVAYWWDTTGVAPGVYNVVFTFTSTPSQNSQGYFERPDIQVILLDVVEGKGAPYDPTTLVGQTRLLLADTDASLYQWYDAEILFALSRQNQIPELAAGFLYDAGAGDASKVAYVYSTLQSHTDLSKVPQMMREQANQWRMLAPIAPSIQSADAIFTLDSNNGQSPGTLHLW
jgi:hypothetical protein